MISSTRGIVIHHLKYSDTSLIATIYTELFGRKSFLIKGVYKPKSRFRANLFQPLNLLQIEVDISTRRNLQRIRELSATPVINTIHTDLHKQAIAFFIAEVLFKTVKEEEANPGLFEFLFHTVQYLDARNTEFANFHLVFLTHLSKYLGFFPRNNFSENKPIFDSLSGCFIAINDININSHNEQISKKMHHLLKLNFEKAGLLAINRLERMELMEVLIDYFSIHLHGKLKIQSLQVLKELFD